MTRTPLPDRRPSATINAAWQQHAFTVTIGFDPATGTPREVFADTLHGGDMQAALTDACVLISIALQHGITPGALGKSIGRIPVMEWDSTAQAMIEVERPASPVGAIIEALKAEVRE